MVNGMSSVGQPQEIELKEPYHPNFYDLVVKFWNADATKKIIKDNHSF